MRAAWLIMDPILWDGWPVSFSHMHVGVVGSMCVDWSKLDISGIIDQANFFLDEVFIVSGLRSTCMTLPWLFKDGNDEFSDAL